MSRRADDAGEIQGRDAYIRSFVRHFSTAILA